MDDSTPRISKNPRAVWTRVLAPCVLVLAASGCSHEAAVGPYAVTFHSARLNGEPVKVERLELQGVRLRFEHSSFVYAQNPPFQSWQAIVWVTLDDPKLSWAPTVDERRQFAVGWRDSALQRLDMRSAERSTPAQCGEPTLVADAWQFECAVTADEHTAHLRARVVPGSGGLAVQEATWVDDDRKSKEWVGDFWASLRPVETTQSTTSSVTVPIAGVVTAATQVALR